MKHLRVDVEYTFNYHRIEWNICVMAWNTLLITVASNKTFVFLSNIMSRRIRNWINNVREKSNCLLPPRIIRNWINNVRKKSNKGLKKSRLLRSFWIGCILFIKREIVDCRHGESAIELITCVKRATKGLKKSRLLRSFWIRCIIFIKRVIVYCRHG